MVPVSETLVSVRVGRALMRRCHRWGSGSQRAKSASVREKGDFSWVSLKVWRGAGGAGLDAEMPLLGVGEPEGEVGLVEGEGRFFVVELEVEAGAGGFDVGEARGGAGVFLGGGRGFDVGGVEEDALEVPLAVGEVDEIDAGVGEADGGELDAAAPEGGDAEGGADRVGADDGVGTECGVFVDD